jgi:outer membrane protein assembly factor BamB
MFRGNPLCTGVAGTVLPDRLAIRWRHELSAGISGAAAIVGERVFVGDDSGLFVALDLASGRRLWSYQAADAIQSSPAVVAVPAASTQAASSTAPAKHAAALVLFGDDRGLLHALDADTGTLRWQFKTADRVVSSVTSDGANAYVGSYDSGLYCLALNTGTQLWRYDAQERIHATPALVGDFVIFPACDGNLHVVRRADGGRVRTAPLGNVSGAAPAVQGTHAFLGTYGQQVLALDWSAGTTLWTFEDRARPFPYLASAALTADLVVVAGQDKRIRALRQNDGMQVWEFATRGRVDSSPVIAGGVVWAGSADGILYALDVQTGRERWRFEAGGGIYAAPAIGRDVLIIGTEDGVVYCLHAARRSSD